MADSALYPTYQDALNEADIQSNPIQTAAFFCVNNSDAVRIRLDLELKYYLDYYLSSSGKGKTKLVIVLGICGVVIVIECITTLIVGKKIIKIKSNMLSLFGYVNQDQIKDMLKKINNFKISNIIYGTEFVDKVILGKEDESELVVVAPGRIEESMQKPSQIATVVKTTDIKETADVMNADQSVNQSVEELKEESRSKKLIEQLNCPEYCYNIVRSSDPI